MNTTYAVDHIPLTQVSNNGFHNVVHLVSFSSTSSNPPNNQPVVSPPTVGGIGEIFSAQINDGYNSDESLYFKTGDGRTLQLTNNFVPTKGSSVGDSGITFIPGGITLIWGSFNPNSSTTVTFPFGGFANICVNIQLTGSASNNSTFRNNISTGTLTKTGFTWQGTVDSHFNPIFYFAIGN